MSDQPWGFTHSNIYGMAMAVYYTLEVVPLSLACPSANTGTVGVAYSSSLVASGGTPPYTFSIIAEILPPGLTLNASNGLISGVPTAAGTYPYTAQVTDSLSATATANCSIVIASGGGGGGGGGTGVGNATPCGKLPTLEVTRDVDDDWTDESTLYITQDEPLPFTLRALVIRDDFNKD
jgi:Putative Ig domain